MRILIITRSFAPDSIIAAIRPTKFAKYLSANGHDVVVICSGRIVGKADNCDNLDSITIKMYDAINRKVVGNGGAQAIKVERSITKKGFSAIGNYSRVLKRIGHEVMEPMRYYYVDGWNVSRRIIKFYNKEQSLRGFDVVISTFSPLGCLWAGRKIASCQKAVWIADFRDLMDSECYNPFIRKINALLQKKVIEKADVCLCVSEGNALRLSAIKKGSFRKKVHVIYNGYDDDAIVGDIGRNELAEKNSLRICYTGTFHGEKSDCSPLFQAIRKIENEYPIFIDYAGNQGQVLINQAKKYGMESSVIDHGYLSRKEVRCLQEDADVFLVLSWNTEKEKGILTGKIYEGILSRKPIIAIVAGNSANSELKSLIEKYEIGICYEEASKLDSGIKLQHYLQAQLERKKNKEKLEYSPNPEVFDKFAYRNLAKELEGIIIDTLDKNKKEC